MAEQDEKQGKALEECIESIYDTILEAKYNFHVWLELYPVEAIVHILNRYRGFFIPTIMAHRKMFFVNLYKVLDHRSDSYHFNCLFDLLEKDDLNKIDIEDYRKQIFEGHAETIKHLRKYRHKLVSHIDKEFVALKRSPATKIDPEIDVTIGGAKALLKTLENTINGISVKILRRHLSFRLDRVREPEQIIMGLGAVMAAEREQSKLQLEYIYSKESGIGLLDTDNGEY